MPIFGFHASHEQFPPSDLLRLVQQAEHAGFQAAMSSDHISPWSARQGESGHVWPWLGAAMQTTHLPFGSLAIPGGWRYHPTVVAHAFATLAELFPGRLPWIAAGSGEYANEHVVGTGWPDKTERNARLQIGVEVMRALWRGETVSRHDGPILVDQAKLWSLPAVPPKIYGAALSAETARWMGGWADGLITVNQPADELETLLSAFRDGGGADKPVVLQVHVSWAASDELALAQAYEQWRSNLIPSDKLANFRTVEEFDAAAQAVQPEDMKKSVLVSASAEQQIAWLQAYAKLGFSEIYLHNVGRNQAEFITDFGTQVLPALTTT